MVLHQVQSEGLQAVGVLHQVLLVDRQLMVLHQVQWVGHLLLLLMALHQVQWVGHLPREVLLLLMVLHQVQSAGRLLLLVDLLLLHPQEVPLLPLLLEDLLPPLAIPLQ